MPVSVKVNSPNVVYGQDVIISHYTYETSQVVEQPNGQVTITPHSIDMEVTTEVKVPRIGLMMVGWGGNNGTTLTGMLNANKNNISWNTKKGKQTADFLGSVSQVGTVPIGLNSNGQEIFAPIKNLIPLLDPLHLEVDGWDISSMNLADAMKRAAVFEYELQQKLDGYMRPLKPRPAVFYEGFVAANQDDRADNILPGTKWEQLDQLRKDIRDFKNKKNLDKVFVMGIANTERYCEIIQGLNDTWDNLEASIKSNAFEISPSTMYAVAGVLENCGFINGSPQNTLVPGLLELAKMKGVPVAGDDLKTGQTKLKSVLVDYILGAGLRPESIVSYNHLGNNDGKNLSAPHTFRSKEITKTDVVKDMVDSNKILYPIGSKGPDHLVVIKYVPSVGDSKRAIDEYTSSIAMGGLNTLVIHNTCEDSLLAAPIMLDLVVFMELFQRVSFQIAGEKLTLPIGSILGYWLKAPLTTMTNSLFRQRACIENLVRAAVSLPASNHLFLKGDAPPAKVLNGHMKKVKAVVGHELNGSAKIMNGVKFHANNPIITDGNHINGI